MLMIRRIVGIVIYLNRMVILCISFASILSFEALENRYPPPFSVPAFFDGTTQANGLSVPCTLISQCYGSLPGAH